MNSINAQQNSTTPACTEFASLFQNRLLEETGAAGNVADRRQQAMLTRKAENLCLECPLMTSCLYNAVVKFDVAGYVAGTTARQRSEMRSVLGIRVQPEDFDTLAGVTTPNRQVDHDEVIRLRNANPYESLESIAQRLGCSLSTVKRHLRKARSGDDQPSRVRLRSVEPTMEQVIAAYRTVLNRRAARTSRAA